MYIRADLVFAVFVVYILLILWQSYLLLKVFGKPYKTREFYIRIFAFSFIPLVPLVTYVMYKEFEEK